MKDTKKQPRKRKLKTTTKQKIIRGLITTVGFFSIFIIIFLILYFTGTLNKIDSVEDLKEIILQGGVWSHVIFVILQFLQVTFIPLPAAITTIAGALVFGPWITLALSLVAVMAGSIFAFWLGRKFGTKLIVWIAGEEDAKKWNKKLSQGKYLFFLMLLFPGFPDDILCMVVGATPMSYKFFIVSNLLTRPIIFAAIVFLGSGSIIPFTGWGIPVWIVLVLLAAFSFYASIKYEKRIETFLIDKSKKLKKLFTKSGSADEE